MCVLSLTHVACLMPVNHSCESKAKPLPRWLQDKGRAASLPAVAFARITAVTSQLLSTAEERMCPILKEFLPKPSARSVAVPYCNFKHRGQ